MRRTMTRPGAVGALCLVVWSACLAGSASTQGTVPAAFDSGRAWEHVRQLVAIGPRPSGSVGIGRAREYITGQMADLGLAVTEHAFVADTPLGPIPMVNLSVTIAGARPDRLLITGHYDTKRFRQVFVGANDGGSSAGFLVELARVLKDRANPLTIELVFFDGEEAVIEWRGTDHTYGSREYVARAIRTGRVSEIKAMLLVDMIGDRQLQIRREASSTPWLTDAIWAAAARLGKTSTFVTESLRVEDDHIAFLEAGIPAVDIIDLDYPAWHTPADTLDQLDAASLQTVADVLLEALPAIEARLLQP
jgi:hypothetical protein